MNNIIQSRNVKVCDLPSGYFKERLTDIVRSATEADVWVVAIEGSIGDWSAYIGFPAEQDVRAPFDGIEYYCRQVRDVYGVSTHGDKLSYREAIYLFPYMDAICKNGYRD